MKAVIETPHLLLRPWQEDDLDPLVRLLAKPEVARYIRLDGQVFTVISIRREDGMGSYCIARDVSIAL